MFFTTVPSPVNYSTISEPMQRNLTPTFEQRFQTLTHQLRYKSKRSAHYLQRTNEILSEVSQMPSSLFDQNSVPERFSMVLRNLIIDLLNQWYSSPADTREEDLLLLRNAVVVLSRYVLHTKDVTKLVSCLSNTALIQAIATGLNEIDRLLNKDPTKKYFKQLTRLMRIFLSAYPRLVSSSTTDIDVYWPLFVGSANCLLSSTYDRIFRKLKPTTEILSREETFFLIECPSFVLLYQGPQSQRLIEPILATMVPRYASILDEHIRSVHHWRSAMIHAVHHLLLTVIFSRDFYAPYATGQPFQWLIDHIVRILQERSFRKSVHEDSHTPQTILLDTSLRTLTSFVHEPDLLIYLKQLKLQAVLRQCIHLRHESIVLHAYVLLAYVLEEDDIKAAEKEIGRLLANIFDWLRKKLSSLARVDEEDEGTEKKLGLLIEALQVLVQHDQIKSEVLKQNALPFLISSCQQFNHRSKRLLLESLGSITFDAEAARVLRDDERFVQSMEEMQKTADNGIQKAAEKILWNLSNEPAREKKKKEEQEESKKEKNEEEKSKYQYDAMISYCHADKELVYRIHQFLTDQGFKVWFDRDNIYGPAMQAMADAVENSEFVILCMSDSYKRSVYCQAEAEYAFRCKRRLLPLIVRQGYRADGWLGLIIGSRIYIDFAGKDFKRASDLLLKEITLQRENQSTVISQSSSNPNQLLAAPPTEDRSTVANTSETALPRQYLSRNTSRSKYRSRSIDEWTQNDVLDFLYDSRLQHMMPLCELLNGHGLTKLYRICHHRPSRFYRQLNDELERRYPGLHLPLAIFTQFLSEMDRLIDAPQVQAIEQDAVQSQPSTPEHQSSPLALLAPSSSTSLVPTSAPTSRTTIQTSCNVQIMEKTAYRTESVVTQSTINA